MYTYTHTHFCVSTYCIVILPSSTYKPKIPATPSKPWHHAQGLHSPVPCAAEPTDGSKLSKLCKPQFPVGWIHNDPYGSLFFSGILRRWLDFSVSFPRRNDTKRSNFEKKKMQNMNLAPDSGLLGVFCSRLGRQDQVLCVNWSKDMSAHFASNDKIIGPSLSLSTLMCPSGFVEQTMPANTTEGMFEHPA